VARRSVFCDPQKHSGKISKFVICWSVWSYICLTELVALDKVHLHKKIV